MAYRTVTTYLDEKVGYLQKAHDRLVRWDNENSLDPNSALIEWSWIQTNAEAIVAEAKKERKLIRKHMDDLAAERPRVYLQDGC